MRNKVISLIYHKDDENKVLQMEGNLNREIDNDSNRENCDSEEKDRAGKRRVENSNDPQEGNPSISFD